MIVAAAPRSSTREAVASALHDGATPWSSSSGVAREAVHARGVACGSVSRRRCRATPTSRWPVARSSAGIPYTSAPTTTGPSLGSLLALDAEALGRGARVVVGCGLAPGLTDVLARHAAARSTRSTRSTSRGGASPGTGWRRRATARNGSPALEWRDGVGTTRTSATGRADLVPRSGRCPRVRAGRHRRRAARRRQSRHRAGDRAARRASPPAPRPRLRARSARRRIAPAARREPGGWGAVRVEAWG